MPTLFAEDTSFFPLNNFSFFVKNQVFICVWINIWVFDSILPVNLTVFMPIPSFLFYCSSLLMSGIVMPQKVPLLCKIVLDILGFSVFPYEVDYCSFKVGEELCLGFNGDCIKSIDCFW